MKRSYIIAIVAVVIVAALAFATPSIIGMFAKMEPADHLVYSFMESSKIKKTNATMEMTMSLDQEAATQLGVFDGTEDPVAMGNYVNSILENLKITYDITAAQDDEMMPTHMDYEIGIEYKEMDLLSMEMLFEPWTLAFGSSQIYDKNFSIDLVDAMEESMGSEGVNPEDIDFDKYVKIIMNDSDDLYKTAMKNSDPYKDLLMNYLEANLVELEDGTLTIDYNGKTEDVKVTRYQLPIDMETYFAKLEELLVIFKNDANMQALIKDRVYQVMDTFIESGDYELFGMELAEAEDIRTQLQASYDMQIQMALDEMINVYGSMDTDMAELGMEISYDMIFSIDGKNRLRGMETNALSGFIAMKQVMTYNAFDNDVVIEPISTDNAINIMTLAEDEAQMAEITEVAMANVFTNILGGEAFNTLMTDMEVNAEMLPEAEKAQIVEGIQGTLQMLPFLLQGGM